MIILDATTKSLEIKLGAVVTTNQLVFVTSFADHVPSTPAFTPAPQDGITNNTTPVVVMSAPGVSGVQRQLKFLTIFNDDTVAAVVIVQYNNGGTIRQITEISVPANGTLVYTDGEGFRVINSSGEILAGFDPNVTRKNVAEIITAGWTFTPSVTFSSPLLGPNGTAGAPTFTFENDPNTGTFRPSSDVLGFTVGGNFRFRITNTAFAPLSGNARDIGESGNPFRSGYFGTSIVLADGVSVGLGAAKGRIEFDDGTVDEVNVRDALFGVNIATPTAQLHVVSGAAGRVVLKVDTAASPSVDAVQVLRNGSLALSFLLSGSGVAVFHAHNFSNGAGVGPYIRSERNPDGSTPAPSSFVMEAADNVTGSIWIDDADLLRIDTIIGVTNAQKGGGTVVGDQSSWIGSKDILGPALPAEDAVRSVAALVFEEFQYKGRSRETWDGANQSFNGLVVRDRVNDWWGMNCAPNQTPALNEIELFARYGLTIQSLIAEVQALGGFAWL